MRIPFPNVPSLVGVPPLARNAKVPTTARAVLGFAQGTLWRIFQQETEWGIFDESGNPVIETSAFSGVVEAIVQAAGLGGGTLSTDSVELVGEARVSDFPIEQGGFASYNKVTIPTMPTVRLTVGGSESTRAEFLAWLEGAVVSTDLYTVVTPEITYDRVTVEKYDYSRTSSKGAKLIIANVVLREIREISARYAERDKSEQLGEVSQPDSAMPLDSGNVQPKEPSSSVLRGIANGFPGMSSKVSELLRDF